MDKRKNNDKAKHPPRKQVRLIITALILVTGAIMLFNWATTPLFPTETVIVPFTRLEETYTYYEHSYYVELTISGTGQTAGDDWSDAFYLYTQNGQPLAEPLMQMFDLEIDGQRAIIALGLEDYPPPYNPEHEYTVHYYIGRNPRHIAFRISDSIVGDNSGEFTIRVARYFTNLNN